MQYSLDNERERQRLEDQSEQLRIQHARGKQKRNHLVESLKQVEAELQLLNQQRKTNMEEQGQGASRPQHPRSANLDQLYHESLPLSMDKALSNSGPANIGTFFPVSTVFFCNCSSLQSKLLPKKVAFFPIKFPSLWLARQSFLLCAYYHCNSSFFLSSLHTKTAFDLGLVTQL